MAAEIITAGMTKQHDKAVTEQQRKHGERIEATEGEGDMHTSGIISQTRSNLWRAIAKPPPDVARHSNSVESDQVVEHQVVEHQVVEHNPITNDDVSTHSAAALEDSVVDAQEKLAVPSTGNVSGIASDNTQAIGIPGVTDENQMTKGLSDSDLHLLDPREQEIYFKSMRSEAFLRKVGSQNSINNIPV